MEIKKYWYKNRARFFRITLVSSWVLIVLNFIWLSESQIGKYLSNFLSGNVTLTDKIAIYAAIVSTLSAGWSFYVSHRDKRNKILERQSKIKVLIDYRKLVRYEGENWLPDDTNAMYFKVVNTTNNVLKIENYFLSFWLTGYTKEYGFVKTPSFKKDLRVDDNKDEYGFFNFIVFEGQSSMIIPIHYKSYLHMFNLLSHTIHNSKWATKNLSDIKVEYCLTVVDTEGQYYYSPKQTQSINSILLERANG